MKIHTHITTLFTAAFFLAASPIQADSQSTLPDKSTQPEGCRSEDMASWSKLYYSNPDDNDVLGLFLLHRKLCELVTAGEIEESRASDIFEAWRGRLIREREQSESRKVY
jgi:hypothetical protein